MSNNIFGVWLIGAILILFMYILPTDKNADPHPLAAEQTMTPEQQAEKLKRFREELRKSPTLRKEFTQFILDRNFPKECGGPASLIEKTNGIILAQCKAGGEIFWVQDEIILPCSSLARTAFRDAC
jgi:hypothetical protein